MSIGKGFGQRLGLLRRERSLALGRDVSQSEVARKLKIPTATYSRLEGGIFKRSPELETLQSLASYFGVSLGWLWFGEGDRTPSAPPKTGIIREADPEREITARPVSKQRAANGRRGK